MASKTYRAYGSVVSINIVVGMRNMEIDFTAVSSYDTAMKGSVYVTSNPMVQRALEKNKMFGSVYFLDEDSTEAGVARQGDRNAGEAGAPGAPAQNKVVTVSGMADAKAYLVDHCGWTPKGRPSKADIIRIAEEFGVKFEGLE